jgi:hypothetical protein
VRLTDDGLATDGPVVHVYDPWRYPEEWDVEAFAPEGPKTRPLRKPKVNARKSVPHGLALSDDFSTNKFGIQWSFYDPRVDEMQRVRIADNTLFLASKGTEPRDSSPISFIAGDTGYEVEADLEIDEHARAGLLLFYSRRLYCGLGFDNEKFVLHRYGLERGGPKPPGINRRLRAPQRRWCNLDEVWRAVRSVGLSPERGRRFPEPAARYLCRRCGRSAHQKRSLRGPLKHSCDTVAAALSGPWAMPRMHASTRP